MWMHVTYELLLVPAADVPTLLSKIGMNPSNSLRCIILKGQSQGSSFLPRLIGFSSEQDRAFFELFTTVKGIGNRKSIASIRFAHLWKLQRRLQTRDATALIRVCLRLGSDLPKPSLQSCMEKLMCFVTEISSTIEVTMPAYCEDAISMLGATWRNEEVMQSFSSNVHYKALIPTM